jgi:hypothetical protein
VTELATRALEPGVFTPDQTEELDAYFRQHGYATIRGLLSAEELDAVEAECATAQQGVVDGTLDERYGSTMFLESDGEQKAETFANYVEFITEISPATAAFYKHPRVVDFMRRHLGPDTWVRDDHRAGVIYQDARPGRESAYTRIGWHSDWQAAPNKDVWPGAAFTLHIDGTSPANGFLRVVPGSHRWATPAPYRNINNVAMPEGTKPFGGHTDEPAPVEMPLGFDKVPGEIAVYMERGDVLFHDAYTWHSAARATDDETRRRHVRGNWFATKHGGEMGLDEFVKNAAR